MTRDSKTCLICDDVVVIEVISVHLQVAPLCGIHWLDYCSSDASLTADEVRKYFDDGFHGDEPKPLVYVIDHARSGVHTGEEPGEYRTDEHDSR